MIRAGGGVQGLCEVVVDARLKGEAEVVAEVVTDADLSADGELPGAFVLLPRAETGAEQVLDGGSCAGRKGERAVFDEPPADVEGQAEVLDALLTGVGRSDDLRREDAPRQAALEDEAVNRLVGRHQAEAELWVVVEDVVADGGVGVIGE